MRCKLIASSTIFLILSFHQNVCRGIDCYQCMSSENVDCDTKGVNPRYLRPCPRTHGYCRKSESIYYFTDSRDYITIRECALLSTDGKECYRGRYSKDSYQRVCECKDSGCNSSTSFANKYSTIAIFFPLIVEFLCKRDFER